jgi:hypothetical protein
MYKPNIKYNSNVKNLCSFYLYKLIPVYSTGTGMSLWMGYLIPTVGKRIKCGTGMSISMGYLIPAGKGIKCGNSHMKNDISERVGNVHIAMTNQ